MLQDAAFVHLQPWDSSLWLDCRVSRVRTDTLSEGTEHSTPSLRKFHTPEKDYLLTLLEVLHPFTMGNIGSRCWRWVQTSISSNCWEVSSHTLCTRIDVPKAKATRPDEKRSICLTLQGELRLMAVSLDTARIAPVGPKIRCFLGDTGKVLSTHW